MSEFRKIPEPDQSQWLDEEQAAALAREVLAAAGRQLANERKARALNLRSAAPKMLDVRKDEPRFYPEHWLIGGIWVVTMLGALWQIVF